MAEIITLKVKVDDKQAQASLSEIQKLAATLNGKAIDIKINNKPIQETKKAFDETEKSAQKAGDSIGKLVGKVALWSAATTLIYGPIRALKDAVKELQNIDDELVTVRKVTNLTGAELDSLTQKAYKASKAYGVAVSDYLSSVAEFSRAGYKSLSADLAELSTKTQIVGDVNEEAANQFLLSVDAAYQLKGNVQELSKVLDGSNEIDNKYATSISKIAEGLGKVAPIASQAHISVGELTAAIGTITAVTQRSGTEAATAFRALVLNILGDTKTEIEDGATWTAGEISGLRDVIKTYAKDAYEAAEATGTLINPMEAIGGLAQSMKDGLLTEQKLMEMVSDIGGKLRTSQLLALIQNWDMYQSMLVDYGNAIGSADKEVSNAMDSWTRKINVLSATWTEFVSKTVDSSMVKGIIDSVTWLIEGFGNLTNVIVILGGILIASNWTKIVDLWGKFSATVKALPMIFSKAKGGAAAFDAQMKALNSTLTAQQLLIAGVVAVISIGIIAYNKIKQAQEEARQAALDLGKQFETQITSLDDLKKKISDEALTRDQLVEIMKSTNEKYGEEISQLKGVNEVRKKSIELIDAESKAKAQNVIDTTGSQYSSAQKRISASRMGLRGVIYGSDDEELAAYKRKIDEYNAKISSGKSLGAYEQYEFERYETRYREILERNAQDKQIISAYETARGVIDGTYKIPRQVGTPISSSSSNKPASAGEKTPSEIGEEAWNKIEKAASYALKKIKFDIDDISKAISEAEKEQENALKPLNALMDSYQDKLKDIESTIEGIKRQQEDAVKPIEDQIAALKASNEARSEELELSEKQLAVEKARRDLETAKAQRNVRIYNSSANAWEWQADIKSVMAAEDALEDANKALADFIEEMKVTALERQKEAIEKEYDALIELQERAKEISEEEIKRLEERQEVIKAEYQAKIDNLQAEKDALQTQYDDFNDRWEKLKYSIEKPTEDISALLTQMAESGIPAFSDSVDSIRSLLGELGISVASAVSTVSASASTVSQALTTLDGSPSSGTGSSGSDSSPIVRVNRWDVPGSDTGVSGASNGKISNSNGSVSYSISQNPSPISPTASSVNKAPTVYNTGSTVYIDGIALSPQKSRQLSDTLQVLGIYTNGGR